ncbi:hypothetical protein M011DRAFT_472794 [Sporormia fimetaria CBS 119925]|uniref:Uncharacterized protein n=1 Tax=Sporormia fimetaria CBS 119925 TaxID=1340428 RepID=A0A6A6UXQ1_9PLEO|nr:hypothetical protein M011DRAFT_472794 [Sporormia fimetaria CBS 119925]
MRLLTTVIALLTAAPTLLLAAPVDEAVGRRQTVSPPILCLAVCWPEKKKCSNGQWPAGDNGCYTCCGIAEGWTPGVGTDVEIEG